MRDREGNSWETRTRAKICQFQATSSADMPLDRLVQPEGIHDSLLHHFGHAAMPGEVSRGAPFDEKLGQGQKLPLGRAVEIDLQRREGPSEDRRPLQVGKSLFLGSATGRRNGNVPRGTPMSRPPSVPRGTLSVFRRIRSTWNTFARPFRPFLQEHQRSEQSGPNVPRGTLWGVGGAGGQAWEDWASSYSEAPSGTTRTWR